MKNNWLVMDNTGAGIWYGKSYADAVTFLQIHIGAEYRPTRIGAGSYEMSSRSSGETWFIERMGA